MTNITKKQIFYYRRPAGEIYRWLLDTIFFGEASKARRLSNNYSFSGGYKRIYHYHVRKTGGTSINSMFLRLGGDPAKLYRDIVQTRQRRLFCEDKVFVGWNPRLIEKGDYFYAYSHIPSEMLLLPKNTFTITCFRDPIARVISLYRMLKSQLIHEPNHPGLKWQAHWVAKGFSEFLDAIDQTELLGQLAMFSQSLDVELAIENLKKVDAILWTSNLSAGACTLAQSLSIPLTIEHIRKATDQFDRDISGSEHKKLQNMLDIEYRFLDKASMLKASTDYNAS